jgi:hypothetical protein
MKKTIYFLLFWGLTLSPAAAQEPPNFSLLAQGGLGDCTGFMGPGNPSPEGGLWMGVALSDRWDGLWGLDYYSLPSNIININADLPTAAGAVSFLTVMPSDDIAFSVNTRWYWWDKYDGAHRRFNLVPYLLAGFGIDLVADQYPRTPGTSFYNVGYDILFGMNLGGGIDVPLGDGRQWFLYSEVMDHLVPWDSLTQIFSIRAGFKVMLDSAHVDPFRGIL